MYVNFRAFFKCVITNVNCPINFLIDNLYFCTCLLLKNCTNDVLVPSSAEVL